MVAARSARTGSTVLCQQFGASTLMSQSENLGEESKELLAETGQSAEEALNLGRDEHAPPDKPATEGGERGAGA